MGNPVFVNRTLFGEAYPEVESIRVRWDQDPSHVQSEVERDGSFWHDQNGGHIQDVIPCGNPSCISRGIDWMREFHSMRIEHGTESSKQVGCGGVEKIGRGTRRCMNWANVSITVAYKGPASP